MMPTYKITDPATGRVFRVTGDSPPTEQELEQIFANLQQPSAEPAAPVEPMAPAAPAAEEPSAVPQPTLGPRAREFSPFGLKTGLEMPEALTAGLVGAGRGLMTVARGLGLAEEEDVFAQEAIGKLKEERPIATGVGEVVGEAAPFMVPGTQIGRLATVPGKIAATAALGASEAGVITRGAGGDLGDQLVAAGVGGTVAGALEAALPVVGRVGGRIIRKVFGRAPEGAVVDAAGNPSDELLKALDESGLSMDDITEEVVTELKGKAVDPRQAARKAFLESQGLEPTRAQVSRNAADFQAQQEAAKTSSRVRDALERQEAILTSRFDNAILATGGRADTPTSTVVDALTEKASRLDEEIGSLYRAAREAAPGEKSVKLEEMVSTLRKLMPSNNRSGGNVSAMLGELRNRGVLDAKGKLVGRIDVETAEEIRKFANQLYDPGNDFGNMLLRQLKDSLDDDVFRTAGDDVFRQARQAKASFEGELARAKISKFDARKQNLVRDILENKIDPDALTDRVVFGKSWRAEDLQQLRDYIGTDEAGKAAFNDMRAEVLQKIKEKAFFGPVDEQGFQALSRSKLHGALSSIGEKKLNVLFSKEEQKFLREMLEVAKLREPVRGTALGRGPSAQAIGKLEQKLKDLPVLGSLVDFINLDAQGRAVLRARPTPVRQTMEIPTGVRQAVITPAVSTAVAKEER